LSYYVSVDGELVIGNISGIEEQEEEEEEEEEEERWGGDKHEPEPLSKLTLHTAYKIIEFFRPKWR
jgi:hypothetical protein